MDTAQQIVTQLASEGQTLFNHIASVVSPLE